MATAIIEDMNGKTEVSGFSVLEEDADADVIKVWYEGVTPEEKHIEYYEEYQYAIITKVEV